MSIPAREGASWPNVSLRCCYKPSTYSPNRVVLSGQPCLTPIKQSNIAEMPSAVFTAALSWAYRDLMQLRIGPRMPTRSKTCHSKPQGTVSNAFLKSTKQEYSLPVVFPCRVCFCLSIRDFDTKMLSVVQKFFLNPACPLALMPSSSAQFCDLVTS